MEDNLNQELINQKESLEKTGKKLIIFWFIIGFILGALIF
jgi:hypothetical protein